MKYDGVTAIDLDSAARKASGITAEVMKSEEPRSGVTAYMASPEQNLSYLRSSEEVAEAIEANTSGAPLPNANSVTPARDSGIPKLTVMCSKAGDRYSSAVDPKLYINTYNIKP